MSKRRTYDEIMAKYFDQYRCPACGKFYTLVMGRLPFHTRAPKPYFEIRLRMCEGSYQKVERNDVHD